MGNNNHFDQDEKKHQNNQTDRYDTDNDIDIDDIPRSSDGPSIRERVLQSIKEANEGSSSWKESEISERDSLQEESLSETRPLPRENFSFQESHEQPEATEFEEEVEELNRVAQTSEMNARQRESRRRKDERQKESSMVKKIVIIVVISLLLMLVALGFSFYRYFQAGLKPLDIKNEKMVQVEIPIGSSNKDIGGILEKNKVIKSGLVFTYYVKTNNLTDFKGGYYQMAPNMTLNEIGQLLKQGGTAEPVALADAQITVPEGYSIDQIGDIFAEKTKVTKEEFLAVVKDEAFFNSLVEKYPELLASVKDAKDVRYRLEGYLFPATYNYYKETKVEDILTQMVDKTNTIMASKKELIANSGLTNQQILTLASLVEKEGVEESDRRNIAQVFFNRIEQDMPLQSDISILYAMEEHKVHLSNKDTQVDSPYNLYINKGFGPGPFNNPSEQAVDAVLNPEPNDYIYFLADITTGKVYFANTYEEHLKLKEEYIDNLEK